MLSIAHVLGGRQGTSGFAALRKGGKMLPDVVDQPPEQLPLVMFPDRKQSVHLLRSCIHLFVLLSKCMLVSFMFFQSRFALTCGLYDYVLQVDRFVTAFCSFFFPRDFLCFEARIWGVSSIRQTNSCGLDILDFFNMFIGDFPLSTSQNSYILLKLF